MVDIEAFLDKEKTDDERVIKELLDTKTNMETKSDLDDKDITEILKLKHIAEKYNLKSLNKLVELYMKLRVSRKRLGRKEFIQAIQASRENRESSGMFGSIRDRIK